MCSILMMPEVYVFNLSFLMSGLVIILCAYGRDDNMPLNWIISAEFDSENYFHGLISPDLGRDISQFLEPLIYQNTRRHIQEDL
jgi:hypothetical protein